MAGLAVGQVVAGRYEIRAVNRVACAFVAHRAFDREVEVEVALLLLDPAVFPRERAPAIQAGFPALRALVHPHLRRIFEVGEDAAGLFVTGQLASHDALDLRLERGRPAEEADLVRYATALADALEAAHAAGQVHGWLTPDDVADVAGQIKLSGVGLYQHADHAAARAAFAPAARYLAPETLERGIVSPQADVYGLAALLTELGCGRRTGEIAEATELLAGHDLRLADVLTRGLARTIERRPPTPRLLVEQLRRLLVDERVPTMERPVAEPPAAARDDFDRPDDSVSRTSRWDKVSVDERRREVTADLGPKLLFESDVGGDTIAMDGPPAGMAAEATVAGPPVGMAAEATVAGPAPVAAAPATASAPPLYDIELTIKESSPLYKDGAGPRLPGALGGPATAAVDDLGRTQPSLAPPPPRAVGAVSHKPADDFAPRAPVVAAVERPEMQPIVRPLSSLLPDPGGSGELGRYAPPRVTSARSRWLLFGGAAVVGAALAALVTFGILHATTGDDDPVASGQVRVAIDAGVVRRPAPVVAPPPPPCPADMVLVPPAADGGGPVCLDRDEAPGPDQPPELGVALEAARAACQARGRRLCRGDEWERACRGLDQASFPYGSAYVAGKCNTQGKAIGPTGSWPECMSAVGARDMSGNAAEWSEEGIVRGGSAVDGSEGRCSQRGHRRPPAADVGFRCCAEPLAPAVAPR